MSPYERRLFAIQSQLLLANSRAIRMMLVEGATKAVERSLRYNLEKLERQLEVLMNVTHPDAEKHL